MFGSKYLDAVELQAQRVPDRLVFFNSAGERLSYAELSARSSALACWLADERNLTPGVPVVLYGHKAPEMLVGIFACAKAGHPYAPIDTVYPADRVANIIEQIGDTLVLDTAGSFDWGALALDDAPRVLGPEQIQQLCAQAPNAEDVAALPGKRPQDTFYIIFTSGSTGTPKGVEVSSECVDGFLAWLSEDYAFAEEGHRVWFNRAAYSFDL